MSSTSTTLTERVTAAFRAESDRDRVEDYLHDVRETIRDIDAGLGKSVGAVIILWTLFELLSRAAISQVSIGPFTVNDLSLVRKGIPVIASYYFYDLTYSFASRLQITQVFKAVIQLAHPAWAENQIVGFLYPHRSSLLPRNLDGLGTMKIYRLLSPTVWLVPWAGSILWLVYAYSVEFRAYGLTDLSIWIALTLSLFFLALGFIILANLDRLDLPSASHV